MNTNLDKIDLQIVKILQENGKITNLQLSSEVGLSPAPTLERVKKLELAGIIKGYHADVNKSDLGIGIMSFMMVTLTRQRDNAIQNFKKHISNLEEVMECYQVTGDYDYLLKTMTKDIPSFERLISEKLSKIEEIGTMKTMVILSEVKHSKILPLPY
jgi:Lrp/AsnC family transcriptional regulator, leucine-responsive regulatory protein